MGAGGAGGLEPLAEFEGKPLDDEPVVAVVKAEPRERGGNAAEESGAFDQQRVGAVAGRSDGGS